MTFRSLTALLIAFGSAAALTACNPNPADEVPAAVDPASQAPTVESAPVEAPTEAAPADAAPAEGAAVALPAGEFPLSGNVQFGASKVTRNHTVVFKSWEGGYKSDGTAVGTTLNFTVDIASLEVDNGQSEMLQKHLQTPDFFDVAKFPTASFASTSIVEGVDSTLFQNAEGATHTVTGTLDIHGKQKEVSFPITVTNDGAGNVSAKAKFSVNRQDFDIKYPGKPDDLVRDEVIIEVDVTAATAG